MHKSKSKNLVASALVGFAMMGSAINPVAATLTANTAADTYKPTYNTSTPISAPEVLTEKSAETEEATLKADAKIEKTIALAPKAKAAVKVQEVTPLDIWIEKLVHKESNGKERIKILDVNNRYSYGCLQFQEWTFRAYGQKYGLVSPKADLEDVIYDCDLQKEIAKRMIRDDYKLWQSWYTSVITRNLGLPPRS